MIEVLKLESIRYRLYLRCQILHFHNKHTSTSIISTPFLPSRKCAYYKWAQYTFISKSQKYENPERVETKFFFDGFWVPGPRNPGRYARFYGIENLKHVTWHKVTDNVYEDFNGFQKCTKDHYPMHACMKNYAPDGNIQFREDSRRYY